MDTSPIKITHAVPEDIQRVLDAMTPKNWYREGACNEDETRMCLLMHADRVLHKMSKGWRWAVATNPILGDLNERCGRKYGIPVWSLNDRARSLAALKKKIIDLYPVTPG